ncbi:MAG TPA: hypothetical protein VGK54_16220 [Chloroflexota bacterium]
MLDSTQLAILNIIAPAAIAIEGIAIALLGALYAVYSQFAKPDETGRRLPVLRPLRTAARLTVAFATLNACTSAVAIASLQLGSQGLYIASLALLGVQLVAVPLLGVFVLRLFR